MTPGAQGHLSPYLDVIPALATVDDGKYAAAAASLRVMQEDEVDELNARLAETTKALIARDGYAAPLLFALSGVRFATDEGRTMAIIDDWFDEETLIGLVPADVYVRGAAAVEDGAVNVAERSGTRLLARVEAGDRLVDAEWVMDGEQLEFACTCGQATERPCEHLIAAALWTWPEERPREE